MKIYLSGPMRGYPDSNYPRFNEVAAKLRAAGHEVYNPAEITQPFEVRKHFAEYCDYICRQADAIFMLDGWSVSQGANIEHDLAKICGLKIMFEMDARQGRLSL